MCYDWLVEINITVDQEFEDTLDAGYLENVVAVTLARENAGAAVELGLVITGQDRIQALNRQYRGNDRPTDVIAFQMTPPAGGEAADFVFPPDGLRHLGEIVISYPQAVAQAADEGHSVLREVTVLVIHGVLHLLDYDDETPELKRQMASRERAILADIEGASG